MTSKQSTAEAAQVHDESYELARALAEILDERKAQDIVLLHVGPLVGYTEWLVIASGQSERQVKAMASYLERQGRILGAHALGSEGGERGHWMLVDYGDVIVHLFRDEERYFYDLEGLWAQAPKEVYVSTQPEGAMAKLRSAQGEDEQTQDELGEDLLEIDEFDEESFAEGTDLEDGQDFDDEDTLDGPDAFEEAGLLEDEAALFEDGEP